jgi:hypothetical protein
VVILRRHSWKKIGSRQRNVAPRKSSCTVETFQSADNPDEIDIDDDDDEADGDEDEDEGESAGIQKQAVPSKVFGGLRNDDDDDD